MCLRSQTADGLRHCLRHLSGRQTLLEGVRRNDNLHDSDKNTKIFVPPPKPPPTLRHKNSTAGQKMWTRRGWEYRHGHNNGATRQKMWTWHGSEHREGHENGTRRQITWTNGGNQERNGGVYVGLYGGDVRQYMACGRVLRCRSPCCQVTYVKSDVRQISRG